MRVPMLVFGLIQAALLSACDSFKGIPKTGSGRTDVTSYQRNVAENPVARTARDEAAVSLKAAAPSSGNTDHWSRPFPSDASSRLIVRTGQASVEVDSLESSMIELRRLVQRLGGFVADASVQSGRNQLRSATLELKAPSSRFDELTEGLKPVGRLQYVNIKAEDVSEEFVDLTARVANGHRLEERLIELLRTRTGKLQDVLTVERELARVREEIERMQGRLRFLDNSAQLSTLSVNLYEPVPIVASHPIRRVFAEAFRSAWSNFMGVISVAISSLGLVTPVVIMVWGAVVLGKRYRRKPA
jgi:hypothetical protein